MVYDLAAGGGVEFGYFGYIMHATSDNSLNKGGVKLCCIIVSGVIYWVNFFCPYLVIRA